jgi:hypothetical protein
MKNQRLNLGRLAATLTIFEPLKTNVFMKKTSWLFLLVIGFFTLAGCGEEAPQTDKKEDKSSLVSIKNGVYTEFYPGKKAVKFQGPQNKAGKRNGRWYFYAPNGTEQSMTEYVDGKKHGFIFVRYPNGAMHYTGEYNMDVETGVWKFYKEDGSVEVEKDYNVPAQ